MKKLLFKTYHRYPSKLSHLNTGNQNKNRQKKTLSGLLLTKKNEMPTGSTIQEEEDELHWPNRLERIKKYIADNLSDDLSAAVVSKKFELSVSSLLHIFKKHEQQTYGHYLENARMEKAIKLINEGKWVQEIMDATGYKNRITFYNAFKRTFNHSPRHFQK